MWSRGILGIHVWNKTAIFTSLTNNSLNIIETSSVIGKHLNVVPFRYPVQRTTASNARETTIGGIIKQWSYRFETEGVPEPVESIEHIVAHVVGNKKVSIATILYSECALTTFTVQSLLPIELTHAS